jgi:hypothetical protein
MFKNLFSFVEKFLSGNDRNYSVMTDKQNAGAQSMWGSMNNPLVNPNAQVTVAGTNTYDYPITVQGTVAAMVNITVPYPDFQGRITILPTAAFTWTAAGNIALAGTAVVGKALDFIYNPFTAKWYPSYIA